MRPNRPPYPPWPRLIAATAVLAIAAMAVPVPASSAETRHQRLAAPARPKTAPAPSAAREAAPPVDATIVLPGLAGDHLAVFVRNGQLWILAEGENGAVQPKISGTGSRDFGTIERMQVAGATVFRVLVPTALNPIVSHGDKDWEISLSHTPETLPLPGSGIVDDRGYLALNMAVPGAGAPITVTDPDVGDTLVVVTTPLKTAYGKTRRFVDFDVLAAVQGVVVVPKAEGVAVIADEDHVMVSTPSGLRLSAIPQRVGRDSAAASTAMALATPTANEVRDDRVLLDWVGWRLPVANPDEARRDLEHHAAVVDKKERAAALLDLARLMLSQGLAPETLGYLELALELVPDLDARDDIHMLRGAALVLLGHGDQAQADLTRAGIEGTRDSVLWRGLAAAQAGNWPEASAHFHPVRERMSAYPDVLYRPLALAAIEAAIRKHEVAISKQLVAQLRGRPGAMKSTSPAFGYFVGQIAELEGNDVAAEAAWRPVLESRDQYYRTRTELASILASVKAKTVDDKAAVERLDRLHYAWRGDGFETEVLRALAGIADEAKDFEAMLTAWRRIAAIAGSGPMADEAHDKLVEIFRQLFIESGSDSLPPLRALALFDEMHDLAPGGPDGDKALDRLAERMVQMDLLDQAADIIEGEAGRQPNPVGKAQLDARAAALRLLEGKPELALRALDASENEQLSADLKSNRRLLRARAFSKLNRFDDALNLLGMDQGPIADDLRVEIGWAAQRWHVASDALGRLAGPPPASGKLDDATAGLVLRRAVALNLGQDVAGLAVLRRDFAPLFGQGPLAARFEVLTRPSGAGNLANLDIIKSQIAEVDLFKDFLANYRGHPGGA